MSLRTFFKPSCKFLDECQKALTRYCLSSRIRLARNMDQYKFPTAFSNEEANEIIEIIKNRVNERSLFKNWKNGFTYKWRIYSLFRKES